MNPNPYIDEDLQALAETVRRFADERVKPGFLERDKTRVFDRALLREMGGLDSFALSCQKSLAAWAWGAWLRV